MGAAAEDRDPHAFEVADDELGLVAGDAGMGKPGQVGIVDRHAVDRSGEVAEAGAQHEAEATGAAPARARMVSTASITAP